MPRGTVCGRPITRAETERVRPDVAGDYETSSCRSVNLCATLGVRNFPPLTETTYVGVASSMMVAFLYAGAMSCFPGDPSV